MINLDYDGKTVNSFYDAKYVFIGCNSDYELAKFYCNELDLHFSGCKFGVYEIDYQENRFKYNATVTEIVKSLKDEM